MKKNLSVFLIFLTLLIVTNEVSFATIYPLPPKNSALIGKNIIITIPENNKLPLESFAAKYNVGISNMLEANPGIDLFLPKSGSTLIIPQQLILPNASRKGIIINSAEMRLYFYPKGSHTVVVLPIGIGQVGKNTPMNWITTVFRKTINPTWTPTNKIRKEYKAHGKILPTTFLAGPNNPMGKYALYVGRLYAIHGTNVNFGIGLRVSHGCVRLRNNDIKYLFENVPVGIRVQFINEPVKVTIEPEGSCYLEVHNPLSKNQKELNSNDPVPLILSNKIKKILLDSKSKQKNIDEMIMARSGMPVKVN
ncbi:putative L,D-transpeptidase YbiS [Candidatus Ecksteinia adelgidicola]|nr:putative L,D-transpeptidase YbiS [Candidatus Ecksteinia adelgidicola]